MKKNYLFFFIILFLSQYGNTQPTYDALRDNVWVTGYRLFSPDSTRLMWLDFRGDTMQIRKKFGPGPPIFRMNGSLCDEAGNLLFYSNGCSIIDTAHTKIEGAEIINFGPDYYTNQCFMDLGSPMISGLISLPIGEKDFLTFHLRYERINTIIVDHFLYSSVSLDENNELQTNFVDSLIVENNDNGFYFGGMASVRAGNGLDWWLIQPEKSTNKYYKIYASADSVYTHHTQEIGVVSTNQENGTGDATFSPDGTKYARYLPQSDLRIFDFDRCTGEFTNPLHIPIQDIADSLWSTSVAFSASGKYLYLGSNDFVYQLDMEVDDIAASRTTVAVYDGFTSSGLSTRFGQMELGPDGKIYMACPAGRRVLHVIEYPDSAGVACQVNQHKFFIEDAAFSGSLPNFPNFRLGPVDPPCELVSTVDVLPLVSFEVYPNPADEEVFVEMENLRDDWSFQLYNAQGQLMQSGKIRDRITAISTLSYPTGLYVMQLRSEEGDAASRNIIISH